MKSAILPWTVILLLATSMHASAQEKNNYMAVKGGLITITGNFRQADLDTGFYGEVSYGHYISPHLAVDAGIGYLHDGVNKHYGNNIWGVPITASLKGLYRTGALELYAGGGPGIYMAKFHGMVDGRVGEKTRALLGGQLLAGATWDLSRCFFAGLEGKAHFTQNADFQVVRSNLNSRLLSAVLGYRF